MNSNIQNILSEHISEKGIVNIILDLKYDMELYDKHMKNINCIKKSNRKHIKYNFKRDNPLYHKLIVTNYKLKRRIFLADGNALGVSPCFCTEIRYFDYILLTNDKKAYKLDNSRSREIEDVLLRNVEEEDNNIMNFNIANEWTLVPY